MALPLFSFLQSFFSSNFTDESEAFLLIGLLTDFCGYLAAGQWLVPEVFPYYFVTQISQMTQIFRGTFSSLSGGICNDRIGRLRENSVSNHLSRKSPNKFRVIR